MQGEMMEAAVSLLYPRRCPICDGIVRRQEGIIHTDCKKKVRTAGKITCMKCGKPLRSEQDEYCEDCRKTKHVFDRGYSVFRYRSISGSIYRFKYSGRREYARYYGEVTRDTLGEVIKDIGPDAIIPIPMYGPKKRTRGYNQAEILAEAIGKECGIPVRSDVIKRVKNTVPMKLLDSRRRRSNLKKAFNISGNDVKFKCIILVDDIYTTGSTIDAVSKEFRRIGVEKIFFITLAIGDVV